VVRAEVGGIATIDERGIAGNVIGSAGDQAVDWRCAALAPAVPRGTLRDVGAVMRVSRTNWVVPPLWQNRRKQ
jgi:hypothetical protein